MVSECKRRAKVMKQYVVRAMRSAVVWSEHNLPPVVLDYLRSSRVALPLRRLRRAAYKHTHIYPIQLPAVAIRPNLDLLLLEPPPRYIPMMPNGIGYVHNILRKCGIAFQTIDLNILVYHWYHSERILGGKPIVIPSGYVLSDDPWDNTNTHEWERTDVVDYVLGRLEKVIQDIIQKRPKAVGISV